MNRRAPFTQADVSRALKGAKAAGVEARIHLQRDGTMIIEPIAAGSGASDYDRWQASQGKS